MKKFDICPLTSFSYAHFSSTRTFTDTRFFGADLDMNWCTSQNGKFDNCVKKINGSSSTSGQSDGSDSGGGDGSESGNGGGSGDEDEGLAGWAVALIVILVFLFLCVAGYCCWLQNRDDDPTKDIQTNIYMNSGRSQASGHNSRRPARSNSFLSGRSSFARSRRQRDRRDKSDQSSRRNPPRRKRSNDYSRKRSGDYSMASSQGSRRPRAIKGNIESAEIVCAHPQDPKFDDESLDVGAVVPQITNSSGRDPTMFIEDNQAKPDPDGTTNPDVLMITDGSARSGSANRRYYEEDAPMKPKREPTMYVDGQRSRDYDGRYAEEDPSSKPKRDPSMYVDGVSIETDENDSALYDIPHQGVPVNRYDDPYGAVDQEDYDQYGFKSDTEIEPKYMTSETNAEYLSYVKEEEEEETDESFRTQEPSESSKSRKKKSKKKKKTKSAAW